MPRRHFAKFAPEFATLTERAIAALQSGASAESEPFLTLDLKTAGAAVNVQMQLRQYWASLHSALASGAVDAFDERTLHLAQFAGMLAVRYKAESKTIIEVIHRSQLKYNKALADALGTAAEPIITKPVAQPKTAIATPSAIAAALEAATPGTAQDKLLAEAFGTKEPNTTPTK